MPLLMLRHGKIGRCLQYHHPSVMMQLPTINKSLRTMVAHSMPFLLFPQHTKKQQARPAQALGGKSTLTRARSFLFFGIG